jgi:hypothetical protein
MREAQRVIGTLINSRLTDSVWGAGLGSGGGATRPPTQQTDSLIDSELWGGVSGGG